jgi:amino acid permease
MASRASMLSPENNQHLPDLSWFVACGDWIRLLKVKFRLSTSFLLKATAAMPFFVTAFNASVFFESLLNDREKPRKSSMRKHFSKRFPQCVFLSMS